MSETFGDALSQLATAKARLMASKSDCIITRPHTRGRLSLKSGKQAKTRTVETEAKTAPSTSGGNFSHRLGLASEAANPIGISKATFF